MRTYVQVSKQSVSICIYRAVLISQIIDTDFGCSFHVRQSFLHQDLRLDLHHLYVSHQYSGWFYLHFRAASAQQPHLLRVLWHLLYRLAKKWLELGTNKHFFDGESWLSTLDAPNYVNVNSAMNTYQLVQGFCHQEYPHIFCTVVKMEFQCRKIQIIW